MTYKIKDLIEYGLPATMIAGGTTFAYHLAYSEDLTVPIASAAVALTGLAGLVYKMSRPITVERPMFLPKLNEPVSCQNVTDKVSAYEEESTEHVLPTPIIIDYTQSNEELETGEIGMVYAPKKIVTNYDLD